MSAQTVADFDEWEEEFGPLPPDPLTVLQERLRSSGLQGQHLSNALRSAAKVVRRDALLEDLEFLLDVGTTDAAHIAARLGITWGGIERHLYNAGRSDLAVRVTGKPSKDTRGGTP